MQSEEKLSPSYSGDKKHLCPRKHSLEVTQEEVVQDEEVRPGERDFNVPQSTDEAACEPLAITRVRPVEQGCLKRPISRKMGRQESLEELDKEKLKSKMVAKRQDWSERRESLQKQDALHECEATLLCGDDREECFMVRSQNKTQSSPESGPLEAKAASTTLKDVLYKKLNTRVSEGIAEPCGSSGESEGLRSPLCSIHPEWQHCRQSKDSMKPDRLDFKAPNIEFTRKRLSFEEREDCMCRLSSGLHENLHFGSTRSKSLQLDTAVSHDHIKGGLGSVHSSPEGLTPKLFSGRGESAVEKLQLISSAESPLRKTSSEYKLESRHVSSLKPLEGTLDIGLLSGPRVSKTETCLSKMAENTSSTVSPIWLQSPTERQITIPQLKTSDKIKSPLTSSLSPEAVSSLNSIVVPKEPSNNANADMKGGEKTQDRHGETFKASSSKVETSNFILKPESRSSIVKVGSSLAHEHRGPRHSSHFSSCGKTPSIREVSNEDQEDEAELEEAAAQATLQSTDGCKTIVSATPAKLEADVKTSPTLTQTKTPAVCRPLPVPANTNCGLDAGQSGERRINPDRTSVFEVNVRNSSASAHVSDSVLSKPPNICSSNTEVPITTSAFGSVQQDRKSNSLKSELQDCWKTSAGKKSVQPDTSAVKPGGSSDSSTPTKGSNTASDVEQKSEVSSAKVSASLNTVTQVTLSVNKKDNTVSAAAAKEDSGSLLQEKGVPVSPKTKRTGDGSDSEQLSKTFPAEKAQEKSSDSQCCTSKKDGPVLSVKENTVAPSAKPKSVASAAMSENASSPKSKPRSDPQPAPPMSSKTETKTAPPVPVKGSPHSQQESALPPPKSDDAKCKDGLLSSAGGEVKQADSVQSSHSPSHPDLKQRETQLKSSVAINIADFKTKSVPLKAAVAVPPAPKPAVAPTPTIKPTLDTKAKDPSARNPAAVVKDHCKPKDGASPLAAPPQLRKELSGVPSQPDPPPVLPKPAVRKETPAPSSGAASAKTCEPAAKASKDGALKPDAQQKAADARVTTPDKQASSGRKEPADRKKKETAQEAAQKNSKRDSSRASPSALRDGAEKDGGRCKKESSPRSSCSKK